MASLLAALAFLTTLPIPNRALPDDAFARAARWFPTVGLLIGLLLVAADWLLRALLPDSVAAVTLLALWIGLSGALHWDGLLDCFDALFAPVPPTRRLEILRDVHTGAFALVGGALTLLQFLALLIELPDEHRAAALLVAPVAGRWIMSEAQGRWPYARESGLGTFVAVPGNLLATLLRALPLLVALVAGLRGIAVLLGTIALALLLARWMTGRLGGGLTGDCYGALCEAGQLLVLLGFAIDV